VTVTTIADDYSSWGYRIRYSNKKTWKIKEGGNVRVSIFIAVLLAIVSTARADDLLKIFVGRNSCESDLRGTYQRGIRLDKTQNAYLSARTFGDKIVLMIIQRTKEGDPCGIVRDIISSRQVNVSFEFLCVECSDPSMVVIGTWPNNNNSFSINALQAWRINLSDLTFSPIDKQVICFQRTYNGTDEGEDIVHWARKGISKKCSGRENLEKPGHPLN
jgi:hypothetical protein